VKLRQTGPAVVVND